MRKLSFFVLISFIFIGFVSAQTITVTSPHAGDTWYKGHPYTIIWTKIGDTGVNVKINIFKDIITPANCIGQLPVPNSGSQSWTIPSTYANGTYYIRILGADSSWNNIVGVYGDSGPFTISKPLKLITTMTMTGVPVKRPDLKISIFFYPESPSIDEDTLIEFRVKNIGQGKSSPTKMRAFMGSTKTDTWDVKALEPGRFMYKTKSMKAPAGGWILWSTNVEQAYDADQSNNFVSKKMILRGPDLIVCFLRNIFVNPGIKFGHLAIVKNQGSAKSSPCKLRFYIKKHGVTTFDIPALNVGETHSVKKNARFSIIGSKKVTMTIDYGNIVPEINEINNFLETKISVVIPGQPTSTSYFVCSDGRQGQTMYLLK